MPARSAARGSPDRSADLRRRRDEKQEASALARAEYLKGLESAQAFPDHDVPRRALRIPLGKVCHVFLSVRHPFSEKLGAKSKRGLPATR